MRATARHAHRVRALAVPLAVASTVVVTVDGGVPPGAGATQSIALRPLGCHALADDPAVEAPQYAQTLGASGAPDGWWCQLPHPTDVPVGLTPEHRSVADLANLYTLFVTQYGVPPPSPTTVDNTTVPAKHPTTTKPPPPPPSIQLSVDVNSSVNPPKELAYPKTPRGATIKLSKRVTATVEMAGSTVTVTWKYPTSGVPSYLRAVATVTVEGTNLSKKTVLGVARSVRPD